MSQPGAGGDTRDNTGMWWLETKDVAKYPLDSTPQTPQTRPIQPKMPECCGGETLLCWWAFGSIMNVAAVNVELCDLLTVV